jgi:hypothetical protein
MRIIFHANCVAVEDMDDYWLVGFADEKFDTKQYLMLQRSFADDEQDVRLGMNTYHVERDGQQWGCYGGIERFELQRDRVNIAFTEKGRKCLGSVSAMEITFHVSDRQFRRLKDRLGRIFAGAVCLAD